MRLFEVAFSFPRLDMKREKWKFQNKKIKINVFELVSLLYYFHTTSCFKAYPSSFCFGVLYYSFLCGRFVWKNIIYFSTASRNFFSDLYFVLYSSSLFIEEKNDSITELSYGT